MTRLLPLLRNDPSRWWGVCPPPRLGTRRSGREAFPGGGHGTLPLDHGSEKGGVVAPALDQEHGRDGQGRSEIDVVMAVTTKRVGLAAVGVLVVGLAAAGVAVAV